jgi:hypothetical protein
MKGLPWQSAAQATKLQGGKADEEKTVTLGRNEGDDMGGFCLQGLP